MTKSSCTICGEPLAPDTRGCPICLEPRHRRKWRPLRWRRLFVQCVVYPLLFVATCTPFIIPATKMTDRSTHVPISAPLHMHFPLIVMKGNTPELVLAESPQEIPPLPAGSSYLIPPDRVSAIEKEVNGRYAHDPDGSWKLNVDQRSPGHQRIEVNWINDGYRGGAYDATATSITPLYRKLTGPGYAFTFGGLAMLMTAALWLIAALIIARLRRRFRQIQGSSPLGP